MVVELTVEQGWAVSALSADLEVPADRVVELLLSGPLSRVD